MTEGRPGLRSAPLGPRPVTAGEAPPGARPRLRGAGASRATASWSLKPCIAYLLVEFVRPMSWIPPLALIRPGLIVGIWGFSATLSRGLRREIPRPLWIMFAFLALMALQVPFAVNNAWALWGFQDFAILVLGGVLPLAMLARNVEDVRTLATMYVVFHVPAAIHGLMYEGHGPDGWMGDENDLGLALNAAIGVGVYLLMDARAFGRKLLLLLSLGVLVAGTVATVSRGAFVGLAALAAYMLVVGPKRGRILLVIALAAGSMAAFAPATYWSEVRSIEKADDRGDTGEQRLYYWGMAWRMFLDYPIAGVGTRNFGIRAPEYEDRERAEFNGEHTWGRVAHSLYFTLIPEDGLVGVAIFLLLLAWVFRAGRRLRREGLKAPDDPEAVSAGLLAAGLNAGIVAMLITGAFISSLYYPVLWVLIGMLAALDAVRPVSTRTAGADPAPRPTANGPRPAMPAGPQSLARHAPRTVPRGSR